MDTPLSSRWTVFYKFILPMLTVGGMGFGALIAYVQPGSVHVSGGMRQDQAWMAVVAMTALVAVVLWYALVPLKRVVLTGDDLLISNYFTEVRVPLANVVEIADASMTNPRRHALVFEEPTDFGRRVTFMPPMVWSLMPGVESEAMVTLRSAWAESRGRRL